MAVTDNAATGGADPSEQPPDALIEATTALLSAVTAITLPLDLATAEPARRARTEIEHMLTSAVLPRLRTPDAPLLCALAGPTGVGKSTLLNALAGAPVSATGPLRPTTRAAVLVCHPADLADAAGLALAGTARAALASAGTARAALASADGVGEATAGDPTGGSAGADAADELAARDSETAAGASGAAAEASESVNGDAAAEAADSSGDGAAVGEVAASGDALGPTPAEAQGPTLAQAQDPTPAEVQSPTLARAQGPTPAQAQARDSASESVSGPMAVGDSAPAVGGSVPVEQVAAVGESGPAAGRGAAGLGARVGPGLASLLSSPLPSPSLPRGVALVDTVDGDVAVVGAADVVVVVVSAERYADAAVWRVLRRVGGWGVPVVVVLGRVSVGVAEEVAGAFVELLRVNGLGAVPFFVVEEALDGVRQGEELGGARRAGDGWGALLSEGAGLGEGKARGDGSGDGAGQGGGKSEHAAGQDAENSGHGAGHGGDGAGRPAGQGGAALRLETRLGGGVTSGVEPVGDGLELTPGRGEGESGAGRDGDGSGADVAGPEENSGQGRGALGLGVAEHEEGSVEGDVDGSGANAAEPEEGSGQGHGDDTGTDAAKPEGLRQGGGDGSGQDAAEPEESLGQGGGDGSGQGVAEPEESLRQGGADNSGTTAAGPGEGSGQAAGGEEARARGAFLDGSGALGVDGGQGESGAGVGGGAPGEGGYGDGGPERSGGPAGGMGVEVRGDGGFGAGAGFGAAAGVGARSGAESGAGAEPDSGLEPESGLEPDSGSGVELESGSESGSESESESGARVESGAGFGAGSGTEAQDQARSGAAGAAIGNGTPLLPEAAVAGLRGWLRDAGAVTAGRVRIGMLGVAGRLDSVDRLVGELADAWEGQRLALQVLHQGLERVHTAERVRFRGAVDSGELLGGEVRIRWQELLGSGRVSALFEDEDGGRRRRKRKRAETDWSARFHNPTAHDAVTAPLRAALVEAVARGHRVALERAARKTVDQWELTAGAPEPAAIDEATRRAIDPARAAAEWLDHLPTLILDQGHSRRTTRTIGPAGTHIRSAALVLGVAALAGSASRGAGGGTDADAGGDKIGGLAVADGGGRGGGGSSSGGSESESRAPEVGGKGGDRGRGENEGGEDATRYDDPAATAAVGLLRTMFGDESADRLLTTATNALKDRNARLLDRAAQPHRAQLAAYALDPRQAQALADARAAVAQARALARNEED